MKPWLKRQQRERPDEPPALPTLEEIRAERARRDRLSREQNADAIRARCRTLAGFVREAWPILEPTTPYVHGWHIDAICDHLEAVTDGRIIRLLINVPPGMMKSLLVSVFWPAWEWGPAGKPSTRYLTTSYEEGLAIRDNTKMRRLVESEWYQDLWGSTVSLARDQNAKGKFENTATGGRECRAFKSLTGGRGDRVIIDDPHSTVTAESDAERKQTIKVFTESVPSRVNDPERSAIVIIMQRLHEDDVSGTAIKLKLGYVHLRLPMEYEASDPCRTSIGWEDPRTYEGQLLFPQRSPREVVDRDKVPLGTYGVAGQYQQRPAPREGGLFSKSDFRIVRSVPRMEKVCRAWDFAATKPKKGIGDPDWTAGALVGKGVDGVYYILDVIRFRERAGVVRQKVLNVAHQDGYETRIRIPQDPAQAGKDQAEQYVKALAGYPVTATPVSGDKEVRATPLATMVGIGNVCLLEGDWNRDFIDECAGFPTAAHDDQLDAAGDAFKEVAGIIPGENLLEWYRREAEKAALEADGEQVPVDDSEMVAIDLPGSVQIAYGVRGTSYRRAADGSFWVHPEDVAALLQSPGARRAPSPVGAEA